MIWLTLGLMTLIIFISRYLFLEPKLPLKLNKSTLQFLSYAAPAVLTAIIAPLVFVKEHALHISIHNSYLVGAIIACLLAYFTRNTLLTVIVSMGVFFFIL
ncbi:AzlD domain-containing protein [Colwellia sp. UCD-KL20]|uniref:AzlD domain-containing protein n=1 Tax=Colwellia sp. UCD-KL20 TaxID=1917165 RepID=UPI0009714906|nr:AzlD domain-containing protein [Colwellia sp. UCD-KL20]